MNESGNDKRPGGLEGGQDELLGAQSRGIGDDPGKTTGAGVINEGAADGDLKNTLKPLSSSGSGAIVAARGTIDGVILRLDGRVPKESLFLAIEEFLSTRESFLGGSEVILEWVGEKPGEELSHELKELLLEKFNITVKSSKLREQRPKSVTEEEQSLFAKQRESRAFIHEASKLQESPKKAKSLFDGMEVIGGGSYSHENQEFRQYGQKMESSSIKTGVNAAGAFWDDPDARLIYSTLRSGQKIETDHSLIIFGDVNSGAEIVAGGDIIVLGTLRGVAHAGAYDETGGGRVIFALNLQPTQLRIGMVISRSSGEAQGREAQGRNDAPKSPEIAKVEDGMIVVEQYSVKNLGKKI